MTFLAIALVVSVALDIVEWASIGVQGHRCAACLAPTRHVHCSQSCADADAACLRARGAR